MPLFVVTVLCLLSLSVVHQSEGRRTYTYPGVKISGVPDPYYYKDTGFLNITCLPKYLHGGTCRHECDRPCRVGDTRICYYRLNIESIEAHNREACSKRGANGGLHPDCLIIDGVPSPMLAINRMVPGPMIAVCLGDRIVADVVNHMTNATFVPRKAIENTLYTDMRRFNVRDGIQYVSALAKRIWSRHYDFFLQRPQYQQNEQFSSSGEPVYFPNDDQPGESTSIHHHGAVQRKTPQSDGVPWVTQDPIPPGSVFRYSLVNDNPGTHWYHAHSTLQRSEGLFAPYIVRSPYDVHNNLFDYDDNVVMITDIGYNRSHAADNLIVNSHGCSRKANTTATGYLTTFNVKRGFNYRFRFIFNGITSTKILCFFEKHTMLLTAVDGNSVKPVQIGSFVMGNAERVDVLLRTNQPNANYLFNVISLRNTTLRQAAILHYEGAKPSPDCSQIDFSMPIPDGIQFNKENAFPGTPNVIITSELHSLEKMDKLCQKLQVPKLFTELTISGRGLQMNNITNLAPKDTLMNQMIENGYLDETDFCDEESLRARNLDCSNRTCSCIHTIKIPQGECIEIIGRGAHPLHIHRTEFYVVATVKDPDNRRLTVEKFEEMDRAGLIQRNLIDPPLKDTIPMPVNGAVVLRFVTENPGLIFMHCHIELHGISGMSQILWVGPEKNFAEYIEKNHRPRARRNNVCR